MNTKFRKWKFKPSKRIFISEKRLEKWVELNKAYILDTRHPLDFKYKKIKKSKNVDMGSVKSAIKSLNKRDRIVLVGKELRTNMTIASWARYEGYKRVYLIDKNIKQIKNKKIV